MSEYNNIYINRETFENLRAQRIPYTGFVIGEGYAFVQYQECSLSSDGDIVNMNGDIPWGQLCMPDIIQVQCIDTSKEMVKKSLKGLFSKNGCAIYVVCEGDTLTDIADLFDVTVDELVRWNKLHSNHLSIGEKILILDISQRKVIDTPIQLDNGEIKEARPLTSYEFWLDSPSSNLLEGVWKIANNMGYGLINSPFKLFTGRSLSGSVQLPQEKFEAFLDVLPTAFLKGVKFLGLCGKVSSGLQGYNSFIKSKQYKLNKASGKGWQKEASRQFKQAKHYYDMHQTSEEFWGNINDGITIWNEYSKEKE